MKYLVTGATGLLGNNVVRTLLSQGNSVRVLIRDVADTKPFEGLEIERSRGDVRDQDAVRAACQQMDVVVHAAGQLHLGWTQLEDQRAINVTGTRNVADGAHAAGAKLIHISTVNALGVGQPNSPADEETPAQGFVPCGYVVSKREAEQLVVDQIAKGLDAVIVNPGFMLGPWDWKPSSGRMLLAVAQRFMPIAPRGGCSVCDVRDVAAAVVSAAEQGQVGRRYILAGHNLPYLDLWRLFAAVSGSRAPWMRAGPLLRIGGALLGDLWGNISGREPDMNSATVRMSSQFHYYRSQRAQAELGYQIRPAEETIADAWNWLQQHGYASLR